jgi:hypothetical protein
MKFFIQKKLVLNIFDIILAHWDSLLAYTCPKCSNDIPKLVLSSVIIFIYVKSTGDTNLKEIIIKSCFETDILYFLFRMNIRCIDSLVFPQRKIRILCSSKRKEKQPQKLYIRSDMKNTFNNNLRQLWIHRAFEP